MAEAILVHKLKQAGLDPTGLVDSAGTERYHIGEFPHPRTRALLESKGIEWLTPARQVRSEDFQRFDHLIAMDRGHRSELLAWNGSDHHKVSLMMEWSQEPGLDIPDPYYGDMPGYETVFQMCDRACDAILHQLFLK